MQTPARRFRLALLLTLLILSGFTLYALAATFNSHAAWFRRAANPMQPAPSTAAAPAKTAPPARVTASAPTIAVAAPASFSAGPTLHAGGGGVSNTGGTYTLGNAIGQPVAGAASGGTYSLTVGFWNGGAALPTIAMQPPATIDFCPPGRVYLTLFPGGPGPFTYQWRKNGVNLSNGDGGGRIFDTDNSQMFISNVQAGDSGMYDCVVSNSGGATTSNTATLSIGTPPTISPTTLSNGQTGTPYSQQFSAVGGTAPFTFSIKAGALPTGMTFTTSGLLSGTPTSTGLHSFRVNMLDAGGCGAQQDYTLNVTGTGTCTVITFPAPDTIRRNQPYSFDLGPGMTPPGSYSFVQTGGTMPPGISLLGSVIQGTTSAAVGNFPVTITATSTTMPACSGSSTLNLKVRDPLVAQGLQPDYDGDDLADLVTWNLETGDWLLRDSRTEAVRTVSWGQKGDVPVLGDYDDDGRTDLAVFRPSNGTWYIKRSSDGTALTQVWGTATDVPVPGDYDGDGVTDIAVWRGSEGIWYIRRSSDGRPRVEAWGAAYAPYNDVPLAGDYDGDGKSDLAVFRRATGTWLIKQSRTGQTLARAWGMASDVLVPWDYDGDGKTDLAVWRGEEGTWFILESRTQSFRIETWGTASVPYRDVAAPADYDGDGRADLGVYRSTNRTWYLRLSGAAGQRVQPHGQANSEPVTGKR